MDPKKSCNEGKRSSLVTWVKSDFSNLNTIRKKFLDSQKLDNTQNLQYPKSSSQLAVQKKKVEELKNWLETAQKGAKASILLLKGPPGCGKTHTLRTLCDELEIEVCNWEEPIGMFTAQEWDYKQWCNLPAEYIHNKNPLVHLEDFIKRQSRYCSLSIGSKNHTNSKIKKIIVLKNISAVIHTKHEFWHELLKNHFNHGCIPLVIVWTEEKNDYLLLSQLFPSQLQTLVQLSTINFNKIADTFILKALQYAVGNFVDPFPKSSLQEIVSSCNGDLQFALNTLRFLTKSIRRSNHATRSGARNSTKRSRESSLQTSYHLSSKDFSCEFMHLLGKILYAKRLPRELSKSPPSMQQEERLPLKDNPFDLVSQLDQSATKVSLYLNQNYCLMFSCIDDVSNASHHLSTADLLHNQSFEFEKFEELALCIAVFGIMHSHTKNQTTSWLPLKKPEYYTLNQRKENFKHSIMDNRPPTSLENEYAIDIYPYLQILSQKTKEENENVPHKKLKAVSSNQTSNLQCWHLPKPNTSAEKVKHIPEEVEVVIEDYDDE